MVFLFCFVVVVVFLSCLKGKAKQHGALGNVVPPSVLHPQIEGKELSKHLPAGLKNDEAVLVKGQTLVLKGKTYTASVLLSSIVITTMRAS